MGREIIIACDFKDTKILWSFLKKFKNYRPFLKIGYQLYFANGNNLIHELKKRGYKIFLDLKLHDIPNTVACGIKSLNGLNVDLLSVHAMGGKEMMLMAKQVVSKHTKLLAITQLTSTDKQMLKNQLLINQPLKDVVCHYAKLAASVKIDGVVCAVDEVKLIKQVINKKFITICPGIRNDKQHQDQKRVATIAQAKASGTDYVVIGRPITTAKDPLAIYLNFRNQF